MELNDAKKDFIPKVNKGSADFSVTVDFTNIASETAKDLNNVVLAVPVQSGSKLRSLDGDGNPATGQDFTSEEPYTFSYTNIGVGENR